MSLGATLRQARGARKLTAEQISAATRIPLRIIVAMEQDQWTKVPEGIFARGYLRAYAREVGLDGDALAAQFEAEHAPPPEVPVEVAGTELEALGTIVRLRLPALPDATSRWLAGSAMVGLLLLVYVAGRWSVRDDPRAQPPPAPVVAAVPANALGGQAAQPVGTSAPTSAAAGVSAGNAKGVDIGLPMPAPDVNAPLVLDVAVTRPCWVTASADGARTIYRIVQPGERVQARGRVLVLRVGDAGALRLSVDGEQVRPLGASGEVVSVRITRENYRSLLPPRVGRHSSASDQTNS